MKVKHLLSTAVVMFSVTLLAACHKKNDLINEASGRYFSIMQFAQDQWKTFGGTPVTLIRTETLNGKKDSSYESALALDWSPIFKIFFGTDISDKKFLNHYDFAEYDDSTTQTHTYRYTAKEDDDVFTRVLDIEFDPFNGHIQHIYIEAFEKTFWKERSQKLTYIPMQLIQIQDFEKPFMGDKKDRVLSYVFMM